MSDDVEIDFPLPQPGSQGRKNCPIPKKYNIADGATLLKEGLLSQNQKSKPKPDFEAKDYIPGSKSKDNPVFKCDEPNCNAKFTNALSLKSHVIRHLNPKLRCFFCGMLFKKEEDMTKHCNEFHPDLDKDPDANPLQCKKCKKVSRDKTALWRHVRERHKDATKCPHCDTYFTSVDNMKVHIKYKHPPDDKPLEKYACELCPKVYSYKNTLRGHYRSAHRGGEVKSYRCKICNTTYTCRESYVQHMNRHTNPVFYPCEICNSKFRSATHLKRHFESYAHREMAKRKGKADLSLPIVAIKEVPYVIQSNSKKPKEQMTNAELIDLCKTQVARIVLPRVDENVVTKLPIGQIKKNSLNLKKDTLHLRCVYCDLAFQTADAVEAHEINCSEKLTNKRLNICQVCDAEFDKPFKLKMHMKTHSSDRPYQCSHCEANFKNQGGLVQHEKGVHFGIRYKPAEPRVYNCNYEGCAKQHSTSKSLQRHIAIVHLGTRQSCKICGQVFRRQEQVKQHMKLNHSDSPIVPTFILCKPCKRTYKSDAHFRTHLTKKRHQLKEKEYNRRMSKTKKTTNGMTLRNKRKELERDSDGTIPAVKTEDPCEDNIAIITNVFHVEN